MLQRVFKQIRQRHEAIECLLIRSELDKHINITVGASLVTKHGPEERQPTNTKAPNLGFNGVKSSDRLVTGEGNCTHVENIYEISD